MKTETVTTHDIMPGDVITTHGAVMQVESVAWYSYARLAHRLEFARRDDLETEALNGPVVVAHARIIGDQFGDIPRAWFDGAARNEWNIQGNRAATWARIVAA